MSDGVRAEVVRVAAVRVAVAAYPVDFLADWAAYEAKLSRWVADAAGQGAGLLVFPEYAPLELISLLPTDLHHDVIGMRPALQAFVPDFLALHARLAREYGVGIVAGSYPVAQGVFVNRAFVFGPDGTHAHQDKLLMTRFEAEEWHIAPGEGAAVFDLPCRAGRCASGSPSATTASSLPWRANSPRAVRSCWSCRPSPGVARASRGCGWAAWPARWKTSCTRCTPADRGRPWTYAVEDAHGAAGVYAPSDNGLPEDGVVAQLGWNEPGWLVTDLDLRLTRAVRVDGHVLNWRDRVVGATRPTPAQVVSLGGVPERV